jgi:hypothetical protein
MVKEGNARRALQRVLLAAETMARELRRREIEGDRVAGGLCEEFERARDAYSTYAPPLDTNNLCHVAEALQRGWERGSAPAVASEGDGKAGSLLRRWGQRLGLVMSESRDHA